MNFLNYMQYVYLIPAKQRFTNPKDRFRWWGPAGLAVTPFDLARGEHGFDSRSSLAHHITLVYTLGVYTKTSPTCWSSG